MLDAADGLEGTEAVVDQLARGLDALGHDAGDDVGDADKGGLGALTIVSPPRPVGGEPPRAGRRARAT